MKVLNKGIDMICRIDEEGIPKPIKFKILEEDETAQIIHIERIMHTELEKKAGNRMYVYTCRVTVYDTEKIIVLKYFIDECRWILFKF